MNRLHLLAHRLGRLRALPPAERRTFIAAVLLMPVAWLGLKFFGLARMQKLLAVKPSSTLAIVRLPEVQALGSLVNMAARRSPFPTTCLTRSMLLGWMLARRGVSSELRIGVQLDQGVFAAHAWVEWQGVPVNDQPDVATRFHAFESPVPASAFQT